MGARKFLLLKADIDREMAQIERLLDESRSDLSGVGGVPSRLEVRGVASVLHDFYSGIERLFERIAVELDGELPRGSDWHSQLLNRMEEEVEGVRPRVLTPDLPDGCGRFSVSGTCSATSTADSCAGSAAPNCSPRRMRCGPSSSSRCGSSRAC